MNTVLLLKRGGGRGGRGLLQLFSPTAVLSHCSTSCEEDVFTAATVHSKGHSPCVQMCLAFAEHDDAGRRLCKMLYYVGWH